MSKNQRIPSEKQLAALKPFKKGHKGIGGRPKGSLSLITILKKTLENEIVLKDPLSKTDERNTISAHLINRFIAKALSGDMQAIKEVLERIDGKVTQKTETTGKDGEAIKHEFSVDEKITSDMIDERIKEMIEVKK